MLKEFKDFAFKGNMVDLAVGVIIGGAFGKVITSIVNDVIMPPIGLLLGRVNFNELFISLNGKHYNNLAEAATEKAPVLKYGAFISTFLDFLIVALVIFIVVKQLSKFRKKEEPKEKAPATKACPHCLSDIPAQATRCKYCTSELASGPSVSGSIQ
ncbi:large-conductance mechanosensitive channel protein MscL [Paenibacillus aceris]|uniref:Large-conductance mechanosensitive channel n=1 Tax=Paenibacillus aceris TaxID=869555 RepID=A0ABS4I8T2_9BACL|nr:large-conductance mechanosensitive channel protein MscL [Paenibacillus aceris]MBP1967347.1 large conductance mechanosensitive channel [Paenibacillus aceris]NHW38074.1 large-conductance mechanosensitive channel protein MscL [Paenibacillus aceris]